MPSVRQLLGALVVGLATVVTALPALPRLSLRARSLIDLHARQNPQTGLPDGLGDIDILELYVYHFSTIGHLLTSNSALTLEFLETAFYQQGFAKFPDSDFAALGLTPDDITNIKSIGGTEQVHVTTLLSAIAGAGTAPVAPCEYNFGFTDAKGMIATAGVLENVGVSAYAYLLTFPIFTSNC